MPYVPHAVDSDVPGGFIRVHLLELDKTYRFEQQFTRKRPIDTHVEDLRIEYDIRFTNTEETNYTTLLLYGLEPDVIERIHVGGHVDIETGFRWDDPTNWLSMRNTIDQVSILRESATSYGISLVLYDSTEEWLARPVVKSYKPGVKASHVFRTLLRQYAPEIEIYSWKPKRDIIYRRGRAFFGCPLKAALEDVARDMASRTFIWNRKIYLHGPGKGIPTGVVVDKPHGLTKVFKVEHTAEPRHALDDLYNTCYVIRALLTSQLIPDAIFHLKSQWTSGNFRVLQGKHFSDGRHFTTEVEVTTAEDFALRDSETGYTIFSQPLEVIPD